MIARDITSSPEYGHCNLLRFMYFLQSPPRPSIIDALSSEEENIQLNIAIQQSLQNDVINFIPACESTRNSLNVQIYSGCQCETVSSEGTLCVICLDSFAIASQIVKLDYGHWFDRECIVKWLSTSHFVLYVNMNSQYKFNLNFVIFITNYLIKK